MAANDSRMKLPALKGGASRKGNFIFYIVPLDPALKVGLTGHLPVTNHESRKKRFS
jgi:hypothetical protein